MPVINPPPTAPSYPADAMTTAQVAGIAAASPAISATNAAASRQTLAALAHQEPVDHTLSYVKTTAPTGTAATVGEKCLDTVAKKLYTCVSGPAWDAGTALTDGERCAHVLTGADTSGDSGTHTANQKIYTLAGTVLESVDGNMFMCFFALDTKTWWFFTNIPTNSFSKDFLSNGGSIGNASAPFSGIYGSSISALAWIGAPAFYVGSWGAVGSWYVEKTTTRIVFKCWNGSAYDEKFSIGTDGAVYYKTAGAMASAQTKVASANVRNADATEKTSPSATYAIAHTKTITNGLLGQAKYLFDIKTSDTAEAAYGRIYKDGVAWGSEFSVSGPGSDSYTTQSEDLTADLPAGTVLTLRVHTAGTATVSVRNFDIAYDDAPVVAVAAVNS